MELGLETPSRIMRRIEALEAQNGELPSLPSFPAFESESFRESIDQNEDQEEEPSSQFESTPAPSRSTLRPPSTASTAKFANSLRMSTKTHKSAHDSFEIPAIRARNHEDNSVLGVSYDLSLHQALEGEDDGTTQRLAHGSMHTSDIRSRTRSPPQTFSPGEYNQTPAGKKYDYSISLQSEAKSTPLNRNVSIRNPRAILGRTRTPSLTRTTPSPTSLSSTSTPRSGHSCQTRSPSPAQSENTGFAASHPLPHEASDGRSFHSTQSDDLFESLELENAEVLRDFEYEHEEEEAQSEMQRSESREPTFTDEEQGRSRSSSTSNGRARTPFPNAFSSPTTSTPTTFQPKPGVRVMETPAQASLYPADDIATPANRRHSFLLSLVNTTTRPQKKFQTTPHPFSRVAPTPRPRAHPLSQAWTPSPDAHSDAGSFISTASSHDLTVHPRANASFDPVMGAKHAGRFNAVKLNSYLHGLNRRLQEENEMLVSRLRMLGEEVEMGKMAEQLESGDILEGEVLGEVQAMKEELDKRNYENAEMKAERDELVAALSKQIHELKEDLDEEREGRKQDNDDWKLRLQERVERLSSGFEKEFKQLEDSLFTSTKQAKDAEKRAREFEQRCNDMQEDLDLAKRRAEKAEDALATSSDLGSEVKRVYVLLESQTEETRAALDQAEKLADRLREVEQREEESRSAAEEQKAELEAELREALEAQQNADAHGLELQQELKDLEERLGEIEGELTASKNEVEFLHAEKSNLESRLEIEKNAFGQLKIAHKQLEEALDDGERRMIEDEAELASLRSKVTRLENELTTWREASRGNISTEQKSRNIGSRDAAEVEELETELDEAHKEIGRLQHMLAQSPGRKAIDMAKDVRIELLEKEKDGLAERVRSLTAILAASPERSMVGTPGRNPLTPIPSRLIQGWKTPKTPGPMKEYSWLNEKTFQAQTTPLVNQIHHLQQELHNANDSIDDKVNQLEEAGIGIVGLTERLEDARTRTVALEEELARLVRRDERRLRRLESLWCLECGAKIDTTRVISSGSADQSTLAGSTNTVPSVQKTPPAKKAEALGKALQKQTAELEGLRSQWQGERKQLLGEKAVLQDATKRLNEQLNAAKSEAKHAAEEAGAKASVETDLTKAKAIIADLEESLKNERARLRSLTSEQNRVLREKESIQVRLQRAQSDMDEVRSQLESLKRNNRELEAELRATATVDQKARLLEVKVTENNSMIEHLRGEREALASEHAQLQRRFQETSSQVSRLRQELASSSNVHEDHRHQLDLHVNEIEDLRRELSEQAGELERIQLEKNQAHAERSEIARTVAALESQLRRVRRDAEALGKDLTDLKKERDKAESKYREDHQKAERVQKQMATQIRLANEQAEMHRTKAKKALADLQGHVCKSTNQDVEKLQSQHKDECKVLLVQIKYLKAKFTRESIFRADLGYQKHYLLQLLSKFEKGEKQILAAIARLDYPLPSRQTEKKRPTLRTIAVMVVFISRTKKASLEWREQSASKAAITAALQEVRRKRVAGSLGYS